jgi:cytochrome P450
MFLQSSTLIVAGHDTTSNTLTWTLWELAKNQKAQECLRAEIAAMRAKKTGNAAFTTADYDSMPFLNAVIKEGLRMHPVIPLLFRKAGKDDIIPLAQPVTTKEGRVIREIPVSKGQSILCSSAGYNRSETVWGNDADTWKPERWINMEKQSYNVGMTANIMSFGAGLKGCIGWKFS